MQKRSLYLVDVSSMFFRAFYAIRPLNSPSGMPVNAIYGFLSMTIKLMREIRPDYIAFCFDRKEPSFRKDLDDRYKANRSEMPEDLVPQVPWIRTVSEAMGIPCFDKLGFEADDLIGTLACFGKKQGVDVVIVSGDKDFAQLVESGISLYDTMKDLRYDSAAVFEKWGIEPRKMIDYLAIVGDSSDNVKGVAGVGEKGAQKLLATFDSLEDIYARIAEVKPDGVQKKMIASKDDAFLAKKLVTIVQDVPMDVKLEELKIREIDRDRLSGMLEELGFKTFAKQLLGASATAPAPLASTSATVPSNESAPKASDSATPVDASPKPAIPFVRPAGAVSVSAPASASVTGGSHLQPGPFWPEERIEIPAFQERLARLPMEQEVWVIHSERGLFAAIEGQTFQLAGNPDDLAKALEGRRLSGFDLKDFAHRYKLGRFSVAWDARLAAYVERARSIESVHDLFNHYIGMALPDLAGGSQWVGWHMALRRELENRLAKQNGVGVLNEYELPLVPVLYRMEAKGILIDRQQLLEYSKELGIEIQATEAEIHKECGEVFNIGSPKQLGQILFGKMGLPSGKKTKTGFSTDNEVLEAIEHPVAKKILNWRELTKLKSTYVDAIPQQADSHDRVHTNFNQAHTATGRLSSMNPNLQNIPIRTERGARIRKSFIAPKGRKLISADYSQIELRILAQITEDPGLIRAFEQGHDIHAATASEIFEVPIKEVTPEMRRQAKAVNFGLAYGQGAYGLADTLGIARGEATKIIERYFKRFARVQDYMTSTVEVAKEKGYVETIFGRRRYIDEFQAKMPAVRKFGERAAINAPIQGAASDLVKKAMIDVEKKIGSRSDIDMLLQVHDELVFEVDEKNVDTLKAEIQDAMETVAKFKVPLSVNVGVGSNWQDAH